MSLAAARPSARRAGRRAPRRAGATVAAADDSVGICPSSAQPHCCRELTHLGNEGMRHCGVSSAAIPRGARSATCSTRSQCARARERCADRDERTRFGGPMAWPTRQPLLDAGLDPMLQRVDEQVVGNELSRAATSSPSTKAAVTGRSRRQRAANIRSTSSSISLEVRVVATACNVRRARLWITRGQRCGQRLRWQTFGERLIARSPAVHTTVAAHDGPMSSAACGRS